MADHIPEAQFFDTLIQSRGEFNPFTDRGWRTLGKRFAKASGNLGGRRVLDIGCGTGNSRQIYAAHARHYVGLDLSLEAVRTALHAQAAGAWLQADALRLPFADRAFDVVAFSSVLHHVPSIPEALSEARRVLAPGGLVFAFDPNLLHPAMLAFRHPRSFLYTAEGVSPHEQPLLPSALHDAFAEAGFREIGQRCQSDIPYRHVAPRLLNAVLPVYNLLDRFWEYSGLARWMGTFVVTWGRVPGDARDTGLTSTTPAAVTP
jgi:ubiquinone/menaquinone biosynthesis C-methylase UbiE